MTAIDLSHYCFYQFNRTIRAKDDTVGKYNTFYVATNLEYVNGLFPETAKIRVFLLDNERTREIVKSNFTPNLRLEIIKTIECDNVRKKASKITISKSGCVGKAMSSRILLHEELPLSVIDCFKSYQEENNIQVTTKQKKS